MENKETNSIDTKVKVSFCTKCHYPFSFPIEHGMDNIYKNEFYKEVLDFNLKVEEMYLSNFKYYNDEFCTCYGREIVMVEIPIYYRDLKNFQLIESAVKLKVYEKLNEIKNSNPKIRSVFAANNKYVIESPTEKIYVFKVIITFFTAEEYYVECLKYAFDI